MASASKLTTVSTKLQRIAELAKRSPEMGFTSLAYLIDIDWLGEAYRRTRKDGAVGVDEQTAAMYAVNLEQNLRSLLDRAKSGTYAAPPVRRAYVPKGTGNETRPIGIPTFEDKILQRAVVMALEAIYEQDFLDCSYGFRPGRSAHQALESLRNQIVKMYGGWIVELDIRKFFDTMVHSHLTSFLRQRVRDGVLNRLIGKWLNAGVLEDGGVTYPEEGSPQGGVISPLLSNLYLHHVLDLWFAREVRPRMRGPAFLIRYADDAVMGFAREEDAQRVLAVLPKRFGRFGLTLHPTKTCMVNFCPPTWKDQVPRPRRPPQACSFDMLGFTHYWARSRRGYWAVKRRTSRQRFSRSLRAITQWCKSHRHQKVCDQHQTLVQKLRGHYAYFGITGNAAALHRFHCAVERIWKRWLSRRSQRSYIDWPRFAAMLERYPLPTPTPIHSTYRPVAKR
jgi:group II intron reverse transcriptase/maturase